jgi:hypothetical protein
LYPDGKKHAIPALHRDYFPAKVPEHTRMLCQVTQPPFIAGPLWAIIMTTRQLPISLDKIFLQKVK